jgi:rhodanese-related sulfurtransferase
MTFDRHVMDLQQMHFRTKLAAEKAKKEVADKVRQGAGEFVLLDARDQASYDQAHIPGAHSMPLSEVGRLAGDLSMDREYVVYCWNAT